MGTKTDDEDELIFAALAEEITRFEGYRTQERPDGIAELLATIRDQYAARWSSIKPVKTKKKKRRAACRDLAILEDAVGSG